MGSGRWGHELRQPLTVVQLGLLHALEALEACQSLTRRRWEKGNGGGESWGTVRQVGRQDRDGLRVEGGGGGGG